jgi:hypothetical protein
MAASKPDLPEELLDKLRTALIRLRPAASSGAAELGPFTELLDAVCSFTREAKALELPPERVLLALREQLGAAAKCETYPRLFADLLIRVGVQCIDEIYREDPPTV